LTGDPGRRSEPPRSDRNAWDQAAYAQHDKGAEYSHHTPRRGVARADILSPAPDSGRQWWEDGTTAPEGRGATRGGARYGILFLVLLALAILCVTGFLLARIFVSDSPPTLSPLAAQTLSPFATNPGSQPTGLAGTPGSGRLTINPTQGTINTLVTVTGEGWWPGEPVFVFVRSQEEESGPGYAYAAAVADDRGDFQTAFTFPNEMRWIGEEWAEVIGRGTRSGLEASTRFVLVTPTPTNTPTAYPTFPPTATPPPTDTPWPTDTPFPTATPTPDIVITDWKGEYFANPALAGAPVLVRNDVDIDFNWGAGSPNPGIPSDQFSVRWTRQLRFKEGTYRLGITVDDGVRFWMDGHLLIDEWHDGSQTTYTVDVYTSAGDHSLQLEYYEGLGGAMVRFSRSKIQPPTETPLPTDTPQPTDTPPPTQPPTSPLPDRWQAEYYANMDLLRRPILVREDPEINFDWGVGSPDERIPVDGFSARWTGKTWVSGGLYVYYLTVDDGARVWLDGQLVLDAWPAIIGQTYSTQLQLEEGVHTFQVEYFEALSDARIRLWAETMASPMSASP
jgi:hypothetical protein